MTLLYSHPSRVGPNNEIDSLAHIPTKNLYSTIKFPSIRINLEVTSLVV